ncbi:MAG TPA: hypothetical protein VGX48_04775 [Pyrinomonadaceae bacterium]|jgi:hypothetical protein|nr:hypothetical protein [Pyrinomonadaceae bacterium]
MIIFDGAAPTFYPVADDEKSGGGSGVVRGFRRTSSARGAGGPPLDTVTVYFRREGAGVRVKVQAYFGAGEPREGLQVADCFLTEGQECVAGKLSGYGVEPLRLGVVRRADVELSPPRVDNRTRAVEVTGIEVRDEEPSFVLKLRNASDKHIRAVEIKEMRGWRPKGSPPHFDWKAMTALKPGEEWRVKLEFGWNSKTIDGVHTVEPPNRIVISSVLFTDGTYEGDSAFAAKAEAYKLGRRSQLARVLDIMREVEESPSGDVRDAARQIGVRVEMLDCTAEWGVVVELAGRYSASANGQLEEIKSSVEAGMEWQRSAVVDEMRAYANAPAPPTELGKVRAWIKSWRERHEQILAGI